MVGSAELSVRVVTDTTRLVGDLAKAMMKREPGLPYVLAWGNPPPQPARPKASPTAAQKPDTRRIDRDGPTGGARLLAFQAASRGVMDTWCVGRAILRRTLFILGMAAGFGVGGVVGAAYFAHHMLHCVRVTLLCPSTALPHAGPALLTTGGALGIVVGVGFAYGLVHVVGWLHRPRGMGTGEH